MRFVLWEIITSYVLWLLVLGKTLQSHSQWCETIREKKCQGVSDVKQETWESKIHTHTQASNVLQFINVDCTTLMSWELYRSTPPGWKFPGRHDHFLKKCLHPKTASPQNCLSIPSPKPSKPHPFWKNLRPLKKHLQDHKSSLDFVYLEQTA